MKQNLVGILVCLIFFVRLFPRRVKKTHLLMFQSVYRNQTVYYVIKIGDGFETSIALVASYALFNAALLHCTIR